MNKKSTTMGYWIKKDRSKKMLDMLNEAFEYETDIIYFDEGDDAVEM